MKAYVIHDLKDYADCSTVVFAETSGKAKAIAICTEAFEGCEFTEISARRVPALDKHYRGKKEMDWFDPDDRVAMVKEANFTCSYEFDIKDMRCESCPAKQWCERREEAAE